MGVRGEGGEAGAELLPPGKVTHGLPCYGRHTRTGDWKSWEDLVQQHRPAPGVDEAGGYYFNSAELIERKTRLAAQLGLAGVMIWEVGQDCRLVPVTHGATTHVRTCPSEGDEDSLLAAVGRAVAKGAAAGGAEAAAPAIAPGGSLTTRGTTGPLLGGPIVPRRREPGRQVGGGIAIFALTWNGAQL